MISATPGRSISGCMKGAEIRKRKSRCVAVCKAGAGAGGCCGASSDLIRDLGLYRGVRESEDDARGSSTQGAVAVRAHRVMI
jgi:hypothetical protein